MHCFLESQKSPLRHTWATHAHSAILSIMLVLCNCASAWIRTMTSKCHSFFHTPLTLSCSAASVWQRCTNLEVKMIYFKICSPGMKYSVWFVDICKVSHHYSPPLTLFDSTGKPGQHQHHPAVLPWSPPAVSRGVTPGGRAGGPAGGQSSRWVDTGVTREGNLNCKNWHLSRSFSLIF